MEKVLLYQVIKLGNVQEVIDGFTCKGFRNYIGQLMGLMCLLFAPDQGSEVFLQGDPKGL